MQNSAALKERRRMLVEDQKLDAVISLPSGVFKPYAGVDTDMPPHHQGLTMQIVVDVPNHYLDAMHRAPEDFATEAKLAMAAKLFEMRRLSSGMVASLIGMDRVTFLAWLQRFGVPMIDLEESATPPLLLPSQRQRAAWMY